MRAVTNDAAIRNQEDLDGGVPKNHQGANNQSSSAMANHHSFSITFNLLRASAEHYNQQ